MCYFKYYSYCRSDSCFLSQATERSRSTRKLKPHRLDKLAIEAQGQMLPPLFWILLAGSETYSIILLSIFCDIEQMIAYSSGQLDNTCIVSLIFHSSCLSPTCFLRPHLQMNSYCISLCICGNPGSAFAFRET